MRTFVNFLIPLVLITLVQGRHELYEGHQLFRIHGPASEVAGLEAYLDILTVAPATRDGINLLEAIVRIAPTERQKWLEHFDAHGLAYTKIADNLAAILRDEDAENKRARINAGRSGRDMTWDAYYSFDEINEYIDHIGAEYPEYVTVINAGRSYEGRQIKKVRISTTKFENLQKPVIVIDAAIHAREWVTTPVALYLIHQLVVERSDEKLLEEIDWVIIPMVNPDGYEYTREVDRMWRKTRSKSHEGSDRCIGVDGNRNYDHHWGTMASAGDPCASTYEGPQPFSESEVRIVRDTVMTHLNRAELYISLHSHGSMFLYAWGNNATLPPNGLILHKAGVAMGNAIDKLAIPDAKKYVVGNAAHVLYFTTGTSRDWTRSVGLPLTYTLELPGFGYNFTVPPSYVEQIVTETWAGLAAGAHFVLQNL